VARRKSSNKYPVYFALQLAMMTGDGKKQKFLLDEAVQLLPEEPLIVSLLGMFYALTGKEGKALECFTKACAEPKILRTRTPHLLSNRVHSCRAGQRETAFEWLERSVSSASRAGLFF